MKKSVIGGVVVLVIVLAGGGILLANNKDSDSNTKTETTIDDSNMVMNGNGKEATPTPETTNSITIENFAYSPSSTTVKVGTTVTWTNKDSVAHTVTTSSGPEKFDSGSLASGKTFSFTFTKAGDYKYFCSFHPSMPSATVTVTE